MTDKKKVRTDRFGDMNPKPEDFFPDAKKKSSGSDKPKKK